MCNHTNLRAFEPADEVVLVTAANPQVLMAFSLDNLSSYNGGRINAEEISWNRVLRTPNASYSGFSI